MKPLVAIFVRTGTESKIPVRNLPKIHENLFPTVKSEIQIRENFLPRNAQNRRSEKLNSREKFVPHGTRNARVQFQCMLQKRRMHKRSLESHLELNFS